MKQKVLLVGDHPNSFSGNGHMMAELLRRIDFNSFDVCVFAATRGLVNDPYETSQYSILEGGSGESDYFGAEALVNTLYGLAGINTVVFVGLDCWRYAGALDTILQLKAKKKFKIVSIFPYDSIHLRTDWVKTLKGIDFPCVYSTYGYHMLKDEIPNLRYFRPPLYDADKFQVLPEEERKARRQTTFKILPDDAFLFGFFGMNQVRKDPLRLIKAFFEHRKIHKNAYLYMHTELGGVYNINGFIEDNSDGEICIFRKTDGVFSNSEALTKLYNLMDCYISVSLQEGLNWTILEAMLCGVPVVASDTTAHKELVNHVGIPIPCTEFATVPVAGKNIESRACSIDNIVKRMHQVQTETNTRKMCINRGLAKAKNWLEGVSCINTLLSEACVKTQTPTVKKHKAVLFAQHSSAGDVLMSTQCLPGIKARHPNLPLHYMTQKQFQDIVTGNPNIDALVTDWDEEALKQYQFVYNPHGERILPGGFNNLDATLYSMYPHFCKVEAVPPFIQDIKPEINLPGEYIVMHSTGGDPIYRTYKHLNMVAVSLKLPCIQIGGKTDYRIEETMDLRGKLSFRETAWIMKQARAAVVIDSFPSHLAGCVGTPVVVLYGPAPARVVRPWGDPDKVINLEPNKLDVCPSLSNCWGKFGENKCTTPCINTINPFDIVNRLKYFLEKFQK